MIKYLGILALVFVSSAWGDNQQEMLKKIQDYLNGIQTLHANLSQVNPDGTEQKGKIYLKREKSLPYGKLRIEYHPARDLIVVDGHNLYHLDQSTKEISTYGVENTPAAFLLKRNLQFGQDLKIQSFQQYDDKEVVVKMVNRGADDGMSLVVKFALKPFLKIVGWEVFDGQGNTTLVNLSDVEINVNIKDSLFKIR